MSMIVNMLIKKDSTGSRSTTKNIGKESKAALKDTQNILHGSMTGLWKLPSWYCMNGDSGAKCCYSIFNGVAPG